MQASFLQKVFLTVLAGFCAACLIQFYKYFVQGADDAINKGYQNRAGFSTSR